MNKYEIIKDIGGGSYGTVYEGIDKKTNKKVAIKKLKQKIDSWEECMNQNEVYFLRKLIHPNIISLIEVIREPNSDISFVFEFCDCNLYEYITNHRKRKKIIPEDKIQNIIYNITNGLSYLHSQNIMHRDLKPENILVSINDLNVKNNSIKIADFGTAKEIPQYKNESLTDYICTRWYRAPECVLKSKNYDEKIDIWALGCIMAELYSLKPLFPGESEFDQINKIVKILGTPNYEEWSEGYRLMQNLNMQFPQSTKKNFRNLFFDISDEGIDFLEYIFQYDSTKRPSANDLLKHPYLNNNLSLSRNKGEINSYRSQSRKENSIHLKDVNSNYKNFSMNNPTFYNYKLVPDEKKDYNRIDSPTFILPQISNKSINANSSRFNNEGIFYNKKSNGRSKSTIIVEQNNNYNNINANNNIYSTYNNNAMNGSYYNISGFSNFERENEELSNINKLIDNNILNMQNNYDNIYNNKKNKNNYISFNKNNNNINNSAFSSLAKNEIVQTNPLLFNIYRGKQKDSSNNEDIFHNIIPKADRYSINKNNYYMFNEKNNSNNIGYINNQDGQYRSFFGTRYNL